MKSKVKTIAVTLSSLSSFATVLNTSESASAQLNVGKHGIQPGLEQNYLRYQVSGRPLNQMRAIPACSVGFGAACNKAGAVFEKLLESNGGPSRQQLLMKAAGGEENYQNFAAFYGNDPNLAEIPYASFWQNGNPDIVDGYRYLLEQTVSQTPQEGLGQVTQNFYWKPEGSGNSLDGRHGLLDLKYAYGRLLLEEVAKIPNAQQQIESLGLAPELTKFYSQKFSDSMRVLKSGNEESLKETILTDLSIPYSPETAKFGRPNVGIPPTDFAAYPDNWFTAEAIAGDVISLEATALEPDAMNVELSPILAEVAVVPQGNGSSFPTGWLAGGGVVALLLLLLAFGGGGGDSSSAQASTIVPNTSPVVATPPSGGESLPPSGGGSPGDNSQIIEVPSTPSGGPVPGQEVKKVPEPTTITPFVLLIIALYILTQKQWRMQKRA
ncbi:hypothetical protein DP117_15830 [Brasilonema sp. UFV-L1]|uniref:hypothetical protein n=1 Tax=Brasilonema sp. UFV-L1 TaxID=2234130 RepID=UPI00145EE24A|nr:hypothetical protein [Brasilonema sp. UFV-L1]